MKQVNKIEYTSHDKKRLSMIEEPSHDEVRSPFERDRARIIHSAAFRRLQGKTQVFTVGEGDFFRTRLTHSLEVAQVAKGLALQLGADTDLVEAISLTHDIGHPPFGHAGEDELKKLMKRYGGFEANAQNIRILTKLESKSAQYEGLNLTRAVIDGQLKYKEAFSEEKEKFVYQDDMRIVDWASKKARAAAGGLLEDWKSFECEIMDWADDIAYAVHDLEDSLHANYIDKSTFHSQAEDPRIRQVEKEVADDFTASDVQVSVVYRDLKKLIYDLLNSGAAGAHSNGDVGYYRQLKANRKQLTRCLIDRYVKAANIFPRKAFTPKAISHRYFYRVLVPVEKKVEVRLLSRLIKKIVFESPQVHTLEAKGKHIIRCLFLKLMSGDNAKELLPFDWREYLKDGDSNKYKARVVSDYIAGMTDDYAQKTYSRLFLPDRGSIYEVM